MASLAMGTRPILFRAPRSVNPTFPERGETWRWSAARHDGGALQDLVLVVELAATLRYGSACRPRLTRPRFEPSTCCPYTNDDERFLPSRAAVRCRVCPVDARRAVLPSQSINYADSDPLFSAPASRPGVAATPMRRSRSGIWQAMQWDLRAR